MRLKATEAPPTTAPAMTGKPLLRVDNVAVRFAGTDDVLADTSIKVDAGEFVT